MAKTVLITGSSSGIGKAAAVALARLGWQVVVHGRKEETCKETVQFIIAQTQNPRVDYLVADLSSLVAVKSMAEEIQERFPLLNVLINNAGTFSFSRKITKENFETTWAVNYLSRFLLTNLLLPTLKQNGPSRIVDVSGAYHANGKIHFEDISLAEGYSLGKANNQSKLANVLFTYKLARELEGSQVSINTLHPGAVNTGSVLKAEGLSAIFRWMYRLLSPFFSTPEQGAETVVFLASSPEAEGISGKYFVNKRPKKSSKNTYEKALQDRLWNMSEQMISDALQERIK